MNARAARLVSIWAPLAAVLILLVSVVSAFAYFKYQSASADREWAASGLAQQARIHALQRVESEIASKISSGISAEAGAIHLNLKLDYDTGKSAFLLERGYSYIHISSRGQTDTFEVAKAEDIAMKTFIKTHPDLLVQMHSMPCRFTWIPSGVIEGSGVIYLCGIEIVWQPR